MTPQTRIVQSVTIRATGTPAMSAASAGASADVTIGAVPVGSLPPIGFGAGRKPLPETMLSRLRALKPAHLWADLDLGAEGWREKLQSWPQMRPRSMPRSI